MGRRYRDWEITDPTNWKAPLIYVVVCVLIIVGVLFFIAELMS